MCLKKNHCLKITSMGVDNIIITPHNSWVSEMRNHRTFNIVYDNLRRFIAGENLKNIVDIDRGY